MIQERSRDATVTTDADIRFEQTREGATKVWLSLDGASVSWAHIIPMTIRVGAAAIRMDGIGGVGTAEGRRHRGYSRRVLQAAVARMRAGDAALSTLYGIPDFYPKFGYATLGPYHVVRLTDPARIPDLAPGYEVRALRRVDLPDVLDLYARCTARLVGPVVRDQVSRSTKRLTEIVGQSGECRVVVRGADGIVAYLWRGSHTWWTGERAKVAPEALPLAEVIADGPAVADAALAAARRWAQEQGKREIHLSAAPDDAVWAAAMFLDARVESFHARDAELMGRCLGPRKLLSALLPELAQRLRETRTDFTGQLHLATDEGSAALAISDGSITVLDPDTDHRVGQAVAVEMPQRQLARLALGGFPPADVLARLPAPPSDQAGALLSELFPRRHPYLSPPDWF